VHALHSPTERDSGSNRQSGIPLSISDLERSRRLEAVDEITYQLKLRSIGGIIILDFIDMTRYSDRMRVYHTLKDALRRDRVKTTISKVSDLGLIEMTRKRTRDSLTQMLSEPCTHCNGTGHVKTPITVAFEVFREIRRVYTGITSKSVLVTTHPRVSKVLFNEGRERLEQLENRIQKRIVIETDEKFHIERFEIRGRDTQALQRPERPERASRYDKNAPRAEEANGVLLNTTPTA
jgi:ribonuclease G